MNSSTKIKKKVDPKSSTHSSKQTELHGSFCTYLYFYVFIFIYFFIILCCPNTNIYKGNQIIFCWDNHMFMIIALGQCLYCKILVLKLQILCQYFLYQFLGIISSHIFHIFSLFNDGIKERHFSCLLIRRRLYINFAIWCNFVSTLLFCSLFDLLALRETIFYNSFSKFDLDLDQLALFK